MFKKKKHVLRKGSAPGSEAARDKWLVQENKSFFEKKCPGSEAAWDKWLLQKVSIFLEKTAPGSEAAPDNWLLPKKKTDFPE